MMDEVLALLSRICVRYTRFLDNKIMISTNWTRVNGLAVLFVHHFLYNYKFFTGHKHAYDKSFYTRQLVMHEKTERFTVIFL